VLGIIRAISASNILNRNDAINMSGQLAAEQVGQLQKLRELQLEDMTGKAAYQGYVIQRQAASEAATQWFFTGGPVTSDGKTYLPGLQ
jgi:P-type conjugative transfer protein TrbJ